jgi:hypothetical protein
MDGSFLSQPKVVAAARQFVCVRLTTYENAAEAAFLRSICPTGSGELENTVFTILSPDGNRQLARACRSAREVFGDADHMADTMNRVANWYRPRPAASQGPADLPTVANVRLAINVAACDNQPLVVLFGKDPATRRELAEKLKPLAWSNKFRGRFVYTEASTEKEMSAIAGAEGDAGILAVQPDRFGLAGTLLTRIPQTSSIESLARGLKDSLMKHHPQNETFRSHVRDGKEAGAFWETVVPVSDPMERRARQR